MIKQVIDTEDELRQRTDIKVAKAALFLKPIHTVCFNPENVVVDTPYNCKVIDSVSVLDQKEAGTCWINAFASMVNVLLKKKGIDVAISIPYIIFYDRLEKARSFFTRMSNDDLDERTRWHLLQEPFTDGGSWGMLMHIIETYGMGVNMPVSYQTLHSAEMNVLFGEMLRSLAKRISEKKLTVDECVNRVHDFLVRCLAFPVHKIVLSEETHKLKWTGNNLEFCNLTGVDLKEFVTLTNAPDRDDGWYASAYTNNGDKPVHFIYNFEDDIGRLENAAMKTLQAGFPVYFCSDVQSMSLTKSTMATNLFNYNNLFNTDTLFTMNKEDGLQYRMIGPKHAMLFIGVNVQNDIPTGWLVQNSWGKDQEYDGTMHMTPDWFRKYVIEVSVLKNTVDIPKRQQKNTQYLTMWDVLSTAAL